jgi:diguanylate cyclase (GGDEF)-like protein/PAS domain S-box-containing protein
LALLGGDRYAMSTETREDQIWSSPTGSAIDDRYRIIFDSFNDGIFLSDPKTGRFVEINEPGCKMFGYPKAELLGRDVNTLSSGIHPFTEDVALELNEKARLGTPQIFEWQCKTKEGVLFWTEISLRYAEFGNGPTIVAIFRDIAERKRLNAEIVYMAQHDVLTGLANRSMFTVALDDAIAHSLRAGRKFAVLSLDLDHFKDVNDTRGHQTGDRVLRLVAGRLQAAVRVNENVARVGGDEFAILLSDLRETSDIAALANRLIASISMPFLIDGVENHIGVSIGVSIYGADAEDVETLLSHADIALYRAKAEGRQTYRFFSDTMNEQVRARVKLTDELRLAIPAGQLFLEYQPQVKAKTGRIIGVEALVRWRHPRRGILLPASFLPVAESSGLIGALDRWVLRTACTQGRVWIDAGIVLSSISVNLSSAQFKVPFELERFVFAVLAETRFPPHLLELEITENTLISLSTQHAEMIQRLRSAGVRFSLDDFGTGYSSLNYLRRFSIDRLKIAQEFISELATSAEAASIVKAIIGLSRDFGNEVIAEGVETPEQLNMLHDLDCPEVQGFYFAAPMSAEAIVPLLTVGRISPPATAVPQFAA